MGVDRGLIREMKTILTKERYEMFRKLDDELKQEIALSLMKAWHICKDADKVNRLFDVMVKVTETFSRAIELEELKIQKLKRLRKGILQKIGENPEKVDKFEEIVKKRIKQRCEIEFVDGNPFSETYVCWTHRKIWTVMTDLIREHEPKTCEDFERLKKMEENMEKEVGGICDGEN